MSIFTDIAGLLRGSVGNNMDNDPDDVANTKRNFAAIGRYKKPVENGYIDQELDEAILNHQRDNNLKVDGIMKPGGETEASIISQRLGIPRIEPNREEKETNIQQANAAVLPLIMRLGLPAVAGSLWWQNESNKEQRENAVRHLENKLQGKTADPDPYQHCMDQYDADLKECSLIADPGNRAACRETAALRMSQCLRDLPPGDRRRLQTKF